jgi:hypothetical protein
MPSQQPTIFHLPGHYADRMAAQGRNDLYAFVMLILFHHAVRGRPLAERLNALRHLLVVLLAAWLPAIPVIDHLSALMPTMQTGPAAAGAMRDER